MPRKSAKRLGRPPLKAGRRRERVNVTMHPDVWEFLQRWQDGSGEASVSGNIDRLARAEMARQKPD
jgi:hypothetical protein